MMIEICLESVESVLAAEAGGADRVEFCADLFEGGTTPSLGSFTVARRHASITMNVMIRPRGGDFCYSDLEFETMKEDVRLFRDAGSDGIVLGLLTPEGEIDVQRTAELIEIARPCSVTFHRAFDMCRDPYRALEQLIELKVDRVLTSGLEESVTEGLDMLSALIKQAGERIIIMPGCGISERNFQKIHRALNAREYHLLLDGPSESRMVYRPAHIYMGGLLRQSEFTLARTDKGRVSNVVSFREGLK